MSVGENELILVFKTELLNRLGNFQGVNPEYERYTKSIIDDKLYFFLQRKEVETNSNYKQLIPYIIITFQNKILYYVRGKGVGEERLKSLGSIGIGGHINYYSDFSLFKTDREAYFSAVKREAFEEIEINSDFDSEIIGVLNDDSNLVGKVHFGVIHHWKLDKSEVYKKEKEITKISFKTIDEIRKKFNTLEQWSKLCFQFISEFWQV